MFGSDVQLQCTEDCIHTAPTHMCNKEKCHTCNPAKLWHLVFEKLPHDCTTTRAIIYRRRQRGEDLQIRAARQIAQTSCDVLVCPVPSNCQGCCWYGLCPSNSKSSDHRQSDKSGGHKNVHPRIRWTCILKRFSVPSTSSRQLFR